MEGLIPMVYKAIKKNHFRKQYTCLSSSRVGLTYELFDHDDHHHDRGHDQHRKSYEHPTETRGRCEEGSKGHRRFGSTGDYEVTNGSYNFNYDDHYYQGNGGVGRFPSPPMQIKRYSSVRMFSCITG